MTPNSGIVLNRMNRLCIYTAGMHKVCILARQGVEGSKHGGGGPPEAILGVGGKEGVGPDMKNYAP
jgi:hypothetical protein